MFRGDKAKTVFNVNDLLICFIGYQGCKVSGVSSTVS